MPLPVEILTKKAHRSGLFVSVGPRRLGALPLLGFFQLRVYALLYWQNEGVLPSLLQLIYLGDSQLVKSSPTEAQLLSTEKILKNIGAEILTAIDTDHFPTKKSRLCDRCFFKTICPAHVKP